jgi:rRNA-processing protein FCF1
MRVLLDTNFMMDCFRYKVDMSDLFDLYPGARLATIPQVVSELTKLAGKKSTHSRYARVALSLIDGIEIVDAPEGRADDVLLELAGEDSLVATNDELLRAKIRRKGMKTIYLRAKKQLAIG